MFRALSCAVFAALCLAACTPQPDATYYLVRHAEKVLDVQDPPLTEDGTARADALAERLGSVDLTQIYSTDYKRTQATAAPAAKEQELSITSYDPSDLEGFAAVLKNQTGNILVVGHSNTTPDLAKYLGAEPGAPIVEDTEYDRLYVIARTGDTVSGRIETYGKRFEK